MKFFSLTAFFLLSTITFSQTKMRPVNELIDQNESAWNFVKDWFDPAKTKFKILPADPQKAKDALYQTQVTTNSPMGAVIYKTGGILIDNGWIRILGSGSTKLSRSLPAWNKGKSFTEAGE